MSKKKFKKGDIVQIELDSRFFYAKYLNSPLVEFFDIVVNSPLSIDSVVSLPVAFKIWVSDGAHRSSNWTLLGKCDLLPEEDESPFFAKRDLISKEYFLYKNGVEIPSDRNSCLGLELAAVWSVIHVEDRLRDHFNGVANKWVEHFRSTLM